MRIRNTITVADGGDIAAAIATMQSGDILSLAENGNYTLAGGASGFTGLPNGFVNYPTTVRGNGATVTGGEQSLYLFNKEHIQIEDLRLIDAVSRPVLVHNCRWITMRNMYADSNVGATMWDVYRFISTRDLLVDSCEAGPSTGWGEHDGFECTDQCGDCEFANCVAHGVIHGFEVWTGATAATWANYRITWRNCNSYDNAVGYSSEGGDKSVAQIDIRVINSQTSSNSEYDYQGVQGATLYVIDSTAGTTNGSVVIS